MLQPTFIRQRVSRAGGTVTELRAERGWSRERLARETRCLSVGTIRNVEMDIGRPYETTKLMIARAFGVEVEDIFPINENEPGGPDSSPKPVVGRRDASLPPG
jgi:DNA-binding XRE family transcriptional regulator